MKTLLANGTVVVRLKKKVRELVFTGIFPARNFSFDGFKLIPKSRRRGKLQSLRLHINSKTKGACM